MCRILINVLFFAILVTVAGYALADFSQTFVINVPKQINRDGTQFNIMHQNIYSAPGIDYCYLVSLNQFKQEPGFSVINSRKVAPDGASYTGQTFGINSNSYRQYDLTNGNAETLMPFGLRGYQLNDDIGYRSSLKITKVLLQKSDGPFG